MQSKTTLKIYTEISYPTVNECFDWRVARPTFACKAPGFFVELVGILTKRLNMTAQFISTDTDPTILSELNTSFTAQDVFKFVNNGTFDTLSGLPSISNLFDIEFELSLPIYYSKAKFVVAPAKSSLTGIFDFLTVYKNTTWILILATFIFITLLIHLYERVCKLKKRTSFADYLWKLFQLQVSQPKPITHQYIAGNFLILIFALFQCGVVIRLYSSTIKTQAVGFVGVHQFEPKELLNVLRDGKYSLIFHNPVRWWSQDIMTSMASPFYEIRNAIKDNPIRYVENFTSDDVDADKFIMEMLHRGGKWITIGSDEDILFFEDMGYCMVNFETNFPQKPKSLIFRKGFELLPRLNQAILDETINIRRLYNKYYIYRREPNCFKESNNPKALSLTPFYSVMALLITGAVLAFAVFIVEVILFKRRRV